MRRTLARAGNLKFSRFGLYEYAELTDIRGRPIGWSDYRSDSVAVEFVDEDGAGRRGFRRQVQRAVAIQK